MHKKAQNLIEVSLILMLVSVLTIATWAIYNNQKTRLAETSQSTINQKSVNLTTLKPTDAKWSDRVPYTSVETAGALSIIGMAQDSFDSAMSNITYRMLGAALDTNITANPAETLLEAANRLAKEINSKNPGINIPPIVKEDINVNSLSSLTTILNELSKKPPEQLTTPEKSYIAQIQALAVAAKATLPTASSTTTASANTKTLQSIADYTSQNQLKSADGSTTTTSTQTSDLLLDNPTAPPPTSTYTYYYNGMSGQAFSQLNGAGAVNP